MWHVRKAAMIRSRGLFWLNLSDQQQPRALRQSNLSFLPVGRRLLGELVTRLQLTVLTRCPGPQRLRIWCRVQLNSSFRIVTF